jgi:2-polyprenyl-6-methoxyphenol hydroxylase-like FAD-dependent oxidoreductase
VVEANHNPGGPQYEKSFALAYPSSPYEITAQFEDGTEVRGRCIIGCDGGSSSVRKWLIAGDASAPEVLPFSMMNFVSSFSADTAIYLKERLHPITDITSHPTGYYFRISHLDIVDQNRPETWVFQFLVTWPFKSEEDAKNTNEGDRIRRVKEQVLSTKLTKLYQRVFEELPDDLKIHRDELKAWVPVPWDNHDGRVTLAGDAARTMTFRECSNLIMRPQLMKAELMGHTN